MRPCKHTVTSDSLRNHIRRSWHRDGHHTSEKFQTQDHSPFQCALVLRHCIFISNQRQVHTALQRHCQRHDEVQVDPQGHVINTSDWRNCWTRNQRFFSLHKGRKMCTGSVAGGQGADEGTPCGELQAAPAQRQRSKALQLGRQAHMLGRRLLPHLRPRQQQLQPRQRRLQRRLCRHACTATARFEPFAAF